LAGLVVGRRTSVTLVANVATEVVQWAEEPKRGGEREGAGGEAPRPERRREGGGER